MWFLKMTFFKLLCSYLLNESRGKTRYEVFFRPERKKTHRFTSLESEWINYSHSEESEYRSLYICLTV